MTRLICTCGCLKEAHSERKPLVTGEENSICWGCFPSIEKNKPKAYHKFYLNNLKYLEFKFEDKND